MVSEIIRNSHHSTKYGRVVTEAQLTRGHALAERLRTIFTLKPGEFHYIRWNRRALRDEEGRVFVVASGAAAKRIRAVIEGQK